MASEEEPRLEEGVENLEIEEKKEEGEEKKEGEEGGEAVEEKEDEEKPEELVRYFCFNSWHNPLPYTDSMCENMCHYVEQIPHGFCVENSLIFWSDNSMIVCSSSSDVSSLV